MPSTPPTERRHSIPESSQHRWSNTLTTDTGDAFRFVGCLTPLRFLAGFLALTLCLLSALASAQGPAATDSVDVTDMMSIERLETEIEQLEKAGIKGENTTDQLRSMRTALASLQAAEEARNLAASFKQAIDSAPKETARLKKELRDAVAAAEKQEPPPIPKRATLQQLDQQFTRQQAEVAVAKNRLSELDDQVNRQQSRAEKIGDEMTATKKTLAKVEQQLKRPALPGENQGLVQARNTALEAKRHELTAHTNALEMERLSAPVRLELLKAQRDLHAQQLSMAAALAQARRQHLNDRRSAAAEQALQQADQVQREALGKDPLIQRVAGVNTGLSRELTELTTRISATGEQIKRTEDRFNQLDKNYQRLSQQLAIAEVEKTLGQVLVTQRRKLMDIRRYQLGRQQRLVELSKTRLQLLDTEDRLHALGDLAGQLDELMQQATEGGDLSQAQQQRLRADLRNLLQDRRQLLEQLATAQDRFIKAQGDLDVKQRQVIDKAHQYKRLLDENLLLVPSNKPITLNWFNSLSGNLQWVYAPGHWEATGQTLITGVNDRPWVIFLAAATLATLLGLRRELRARLALIARDVGRVTRDRFPLTLRALLITLLLALPWALLLYTCAWVLEYYAKSVFPEAVGASLFTAANVYLALNFLHYLFTTKGLAEIHFGWDGHTRQVFRRNLIWFVPVATLLTIPIVLSLWQWETEEFYRQDLGRLVFVLGSIVMALFGWRVLRPSKGAFLAKSAEQLDTWHWRKRYLWTPLLVLFPLLLAGLALLGYYYTAVNLLGLLYSSLLILIGGFLLYTLGLRWMMIIKRRMAFAQAQTRRLSEADALANRQTSEATGEANVEIHDEFEISLDDISTQTRTLLRLAATLLIFAGLWWLFRDLAPAFASLGEITLWNTRITGAEGEHLLPITLGNIILAGLVVTLTLVGSRNLPGLLEVTLLQPFALEAGNRYAITTIARYTILTLGFLIVVKQLGIGWNDIQWLVAAMGVGLGFGLKDIFANFMSGLIILFERPVRVGDTVTVGNINGVVTRIRIRSTTITDFDNKELVIPNQTLVVESLINWTLSDTVTRIKVPLGIAYGSNTESALRVMEETVKANRLVLDDPAPRVLFMGFGASSLNFDIRVFVSERALRLTVIHELHMALEKALREKGIEIPFPQQDVYLKGPAVETQLGGYQNKLPSGP